MTNINNNNNITINYFVWTGKFKGEGVFRIKLSEDISSSSYIHRRVTRKLVLEELEVAILQATEETSTLFK